MQKKPTLAPKVEDTVMSQIRSRAIVMRPHWYFAVGTLAMLVGLVALCIALVFAVSVTFFLVRTHGPMGPIRLQAMLESFPLWLPLVAIGGMAVGIRFLRAHDFSYKHNFTLLALGFVSAIIVAALIIDSAGYTSLWLRRGPGPGRGGRFGTISR
jgi:hypothetical protein